jgi:IS5 family transposase
MDPHNFVRIWVGGHGEAGSSNVRASLVDGKSERLIGGRAYASDPLVAELQEEGLELIAPQRRDRKKPQTQDGRKLSCYKRRWKIERPFARMHNFRRLVIRDERRVERTTSASCNWGASSFC